MIQLVVAFVLSRIDYCNAVLAALPRSTIEPLQRVQNAAARLVFGLRSHDHIIPVLAQLHWLPVQFRIKFNCACRCTRFTSGDARHISLNWWARQQKTVVDLVCVQQAQAPAATWNADCVQNSLNVPSLSPDLQNGTVCRMTFGW